MITKMVTKKSPKKYGKKNKKFHCDICDYYTSNKKDFSKHLKTLKHRNKKNDNLKIPIVEFKCIFCDKVYKYSSGLSRHRKKCNFVNDEFVEKGEISYHLSPKEDNEKIPKNKHNEDSVMANAIVKLVEQNAEMMKCMKEQNAEMMKCMKEQSIVNQNNTTNNISINFFLNEQCKNAMNLTDFINQLQVSLEDLQYSKNNGFIEGVTNIFTKQLQDLKPTERPIHCSDKDKLQFYIKDNNEWKEDKSNKEMKKTISQVERKQVFQLKEWEKAHPTYLTDENLYITWQSMIHKIMHPNIVNQDTVEKNLTDIVDINDVMD